MLHTTFTLALDHGACQEGVDAMRVVLGPDWGDEQPIPLSRIALEGRGLADALWCLWAVLPEEAKECTRISLLLTADFAEHVLHYYESTYPDDDRIRAYIGATRRYANGQATLDEWTKTRAVAEAAAATATAFWAAVGAVAKDAHWRAARAAWAAVDPPVWEVPWGTDKQWHLETFLRYMREERTR